MVLGVEFSEGQTACRLDDLSERVCVRDKVGERNIAVFWYGPTETAVAFCRERATSRSRCRLIKSHRKLLHSRIGKPDRAGLSRIVPSTGRCGEKNLHGSTAPSAAGMHGLQNIREHCCMQNRRSNTVAFVGMLALDLTIHCQCAPAQVATRPFHGALLAAEQITESRLSTLKSSGVDAITGPIHGRVALRATEDVACERIRNAGFALSFWIKVARCPELADAHPDWMASLQAHSEWRRLFKDSSIPGDGEVVKTHPWVPILDKEPFAGQLSRIESLLQGRPAVAGVFLNDIHGAPSACGCGRHLCRWPSDYGKLRTTTPLGNKAPADLVKAVQTLVPQSEVIPVWMTECEQHDGAHDGLCAGVGCVKRICWKARTAQLMPVAEQCSTLGALLPYRSFQRDLPIYGPEAGWIRHFQRLDYWPCCRGGT